MKNLNHWAWDYSVSVVFFILVAIDWQKNWLAGVACILWTALISYRLFINSKPKKV